MRRITRYRSEKMPQYLLTHPDSEARLDYVQSLLDNEVKTETKKTTASEIEFLRFKYRVMSLVKDKTTFRTYLASIMSNGQSTPLAVNMAKYGMSQLDRQENYFDSSLRLLDEVIAHIHSIPFCRLTEELFSWPPARSRRPAGRCRRFCKRIRTMSTPCFIRPRPCCNRGISPRPKPYLKDVALEMPEYPKVYFELGQIAENQGKGGAASFYLGKYYLYGGKIPLARESFRKAVKNTSTPAPMREESKNLLETIKRLDEVD